MDHDKKSNELPKTTKVTWFEFLLRDDLLEKHLKQVDADPSPAELISTFLHQAEVAISVVRDLKPEDGNGEDVIKIEENGGRGSALQPTSKKAHALCLLALRVAAFIKWNLNKLQEKVPLLMVHKVLQQLLNATLPVDLQQKPHTDLEFSALPGEALFAVQLYARWCLQTVILDRFPKKPTKTVNVQVPGLTESHEEAASAREPLLNSAAPRMVEILFQQVIQARDLFVFITDFTLHSVVDSVCVLERMLDTETDVIMPTFDCFSLLNENVKEAVHDWSRGLLIPRAELICQMCYDIGCMSFSMDDINKARHMFANAKTMFGTGSPKVYCDIDEVKLQGYLAACGGDDPKSSLQAKLQHLINSNLTQDVVSLLLTDNICQQLSLSFRISVEEQLAARSDCDATMLFQVATCNAVRRVHSDLLVPAHYFIHLEKQPGDMTFVIKVFDDAMRFGSLSQKTSVKNFVRFMCNRFPNNDILLKKFKDILSSEETKQVATQQNKVSMTACPPLQENENPGGPLLQSVQEHELRMTFDPLTVKKLVKLPTFKRLNVHQILALSDTWWLSRDVYGCLEGTTQGFERIYVQILMAKARTCTALQLYDTCRTLLQAANTAVSEISYSMSRIIQWELLNTDLLQYDQTEKLPMGTSMQDLVKKAKTCLTAIQCKQEVHPRIETVALCVAFLLTAKEWDYFLTIEVSANGHIQLARLLSSLCKELPTIKTARKAARDLWDAVVLIFTESQQQKRSAGGMTTYVHRDRSIGLLPQPLFNDFISKIKEPVAISALLSCITKLYNILKDDITSEILSDYIAFWPTAQMQSSNTLSVAGVATSVDIIMTYALQFNPANQSWLRTQADIHYAHNHHSQALKYYIESAVLATDFFSEMVPKVTLDDSMVKRMIKCCSYLQCHTQVAVLCQFLDEVDYNTAFKALQERNTHDAMDTYYECIWDVTILEYLINLHTKRGELEQKQLVMKIIGQLELNCSNPMEIQMEAAKCRKTRFLQAMAKQYL